MAEVLNAHLTHPDASKPLQRLRRQYIVLTCALALPLLWAFIAVRNLYPFAASTMMMDGGRLDRPRTYYVLLGETVSGEVVELPPIRMTDALSGRIWSLVAATVENKSFTIRWPHPANAHLAHEAGGTDRLPIAVRLPELLKTWGDTYNAGLPEGSAQRLRAVVLERYRWDGLAYADYRILRNSWRREL